MAGIVKNEKGFLIIKMSVAEAINKCGFGYYNSNTLHCDNCNNILKGNVSVYYVAAMNRVLCKECYKEWYAHATRYTADIDFETKQFRHYLITLGLLDKIKTIAFIRPIRYCDDRNVHHYCGYVGVKDNSLLPKAYMDDDYDSESNEKCLDSIIDVHGGITFAGQFSDKKISIIPVTTIPVDYLDYRYYGFDLNHSNDNETGKSVDFNYALQQTKSLKKQIDDLIKKHLYNL